MSFWRRVRRDSKVEDEEEDGDGVRRLRRASAICVDERSFAITLAEDACVSRWRVTGRPWPQPSSRKVGVLVLVLVLL